MKLSIIKVPLTDFYIDIVIGGSKIEYMKFQQKRYGITEIESEESDKNECNTIQSGKKSEMKGETRFLIKLEKSPRADLPVFVHELWHLMWHISRTISDFELNQKTQSWAANMFEELFKLIIDAKYEKL